MHDPAAEQLAAQLAARLPAPARTHVGAFAQLMLAVAGGSAVPKVLQAFVAEHGMASGGTAQALAGRTLATGGRVVAFGSGNRFGDVSIGSVVAGSQLNVTINLFTVSPPVTVSAPTSVPSPALQPASADIPDAVQRAVLAGIASVEASGSACTITSAAQASGHSPETVVDEVELLDQAGFVKVQRYLGGTQVRLTAAGRKLLRTPASS